MVKAWFAAAWLRCEEQSPRNALSAQPWDQGSIHWKTLGNHVFLAVPVCRGAVMPAVALLSRANAYGFQETLKTLGKSIDSTIAPRSQGKLEYMDWSTKVTGGYTLWKKV